MTWASARSDQNLEEEAAVEATATHPRVVVAGVSPMVAAGVSPTVAAGVSPMVVEAGDSPMVAEAGDSPMVGNPVSRKPT